MGRRSCLWCGRLAGPSPPGPACSHTSPSLQPRQASTSGNCAQPQHLSHLLIVCSSASMQAGLLITQALTFVLTLSQHCSMPGSDATHSLPASSCEVVLMEYCVSSDALQHADSLGFLLAGRWSSHLAQHARRVSAPHVCMRRSDPLSSRDSALPATPTPSPSGPSTMVSLWRCPTETRPPSCPVWATPCPSPAARESTHPPSSAARKPFLPPITRTSSTLCNDLCHPQRLCPCVPRDCC